MKHSKKTQIVIIGDSNTAGYGLDCIEQSYPYKLNKLLGNSVCIHNMGVSGTCVINTTLQGRIVGMPYVRQPEYKTALNIDGQIFIINLGTNDAQDGIDDTMPFQDEFSNIIKYHMMFYKDYKRIIDNIIKVHPQAKIVVCTPVPVRMCIWRKHQHKYLEMLLPYFEDILKDYDKIKCIDL